MSHSKAIEAKDKIGRIYVAFTIVFIVIFGGMKALSLFVSALNF